MSRGEDLRQLLELQSKVARNIDGGKFYGWFLGLAVPFVLAIRVRYNTGMTRDEGEERSVQHLAPVIPGDYRRDNTVPVIIDSPDEHAINPNYFQFLSARQMAKLDALAFRFDGYPALTRESMINQIKLSDATNKAVVKFVQEVRNEIVLRRARENFAAKLPKDHAYRDCFLDGNICAHVNIGILEILTDVECNRLDAFLKDNNSPEAVLSVETIAELPFGIDALRAFVDGYKLPSE